MADPRDDAPPERDLETVFRALAPAVLGYLRSSGVPDGDELLGDVFLAIAARLDRFHGDDDALRRWVFTIAHHKVVDERRRIFRRHRARSGHAALVPPPSEPVDTDLLAAIATLTRDQREVIALRFVADLSLETVAAMTGRTVGATKALQHRALDALARQLNSRQ